MAELLHPPIDPLPAPRTSTAPEPEGGHRLVNNGSPALATSEWLLLIDAGFNSDQAGTAFQMYDCLSTLTAPGGAFMAGLGQYGISQCTPVGQSWELDVPVGETGSQRVK